MTLKRIKSRADPNFLLREHALRKDQLAARRTDPVVDRTDLFLGYTSICRSVRHPQHSSLRENRVAHGGLPPSSSYKII